MSYWLYHLLQSFFNAYLSIKKDQVKKRARLGESFVLIAYYYEIKIFKGMRLQSDVLS
jgi:hypothetical protein